MKQTCVGVLVCGWLALAAGCSEVGSDSSSGAGQMGGDAADDQRVDDDARGGGESRASAKVKPATTADIAQTGDDSATPVAEEGSPKSEQPGSAAAPAVEPSTSVAATESNAVTPPKPAAAASDGHLAPQQVATGGDGRAKNVTFDNIKFPMDDPKSRMFKREMLTESIEELSGTRIRIRGFILPGALEEFSNFVLVRDNQECCFGPGAAIYDSIMVDLKQDSASGASTVKFTTRPITVEGVFEVKELIGPDKKHWSIYRLTATKVE
ncbi:MAG: hypothetical protein DCC68_14495 [Planctomycetota bacterium]|nr:MAG: hypothetical protein DCC68_14495 [Planctomycetota bacterium]